MSLLFISSCDTAIPLAQYFDTVNHVQYASGGRLGTQAIQGTQAAYTAVRACKRVASGDEMAFGALTTIGTITGFDAYLIGSLHYTAGSTFAAGTKQLTLIFLGDGTLKVMRGDWDGTEIDATAAGLIVSDSTHYFEFRARIANSGGEYEVRIDDEVVLEGTGDTQNLGTALVDGSEWVPWLMDDLYISDGEFMGRHFHVIANEMATPASVQFAPGTVAAIRATDGAFNVSDATGDVDLYTPVALADAIGPRAVQSAIVGLRASSGTVADLVQIAGTTTPGSTHTLTGSSDCYFQMRETIPGGAAWTRSIYNASKRGYTRVS